ncbi:MAG: cob(I)yrinic acid a,c-diamide adenosyltransferase [Candidatus Pacebacteria bacterium]|nr:cob(I)yrinic acid a,c-diamide adenosyltransferase [Candidatus Paceibacterota bacterium]
MRGVSPHDPFEHGGLGKKIKSLLLHQRTAYIITKITRIVNCADFCYIVTMLYTGKGDKGTTKTFGECDQRISKSSAVAEALGTLDEINSFLGVVKMKPRSREITVPRGDGMRSKIVDVVSQAQQNLFIVQAEVAGADKHITLEKISELEVIINATELELPPIKTFFVSGGTELGALLDVARTFARRAERRVVAVSEEGKVPVGKDTLAYLNRLSSLLYAMARQVNHKSGITEEPPTYW